MLVGRLDEVDVVAVRRARGRVLSVLGELFDGFDWAMPVTRRRGEAAEGRGAVTVELLDIGVAEREVNRWDAVLVVTDDDLDAVDKPFALAAPSRALSASVISTARLDPDAAGETDEATRVDVLARRLEALAQHLIGHMLDVPHAADPFDVMHDLKGVDDLDAMRGFGVNSLGVLATELRAVADERLEESADHRHDGWPVRFYLNVLRHNGRDIGRAVRRIRPWEFPLRLSRLTTAAASTMFVLLLTAEAWDLGMSQPPWRVAVLSVGVLVGASIYIVRKQNLLVRRGHRMLSEQRAVGNWAVVLAVAIGMATTYALLVAAVVALAGLLYPADLVGSWAASVEVRAGHYLTLACFVAALGIVIGALGAGFESQTYFRHVALVDEET